MCPCIRCIVKPMCKSRFDETYKNSYFGAASITNFAVHIKCDQLMKFINGASIEGINKGRAVFNLQPLIDITKEKKMNPCKECLVRAACKEECENLVTYLKYQLDDDYHRSYRYVARKYREGIMELVGDDKYVICAYINEKSM